MWLNRRPHRGDRARVARAGVALYRQAVEAARAPVFYGPTEEGAAARAAGGGFGVPDTLDGRYDMICLMVALLVRRLRQPAPALAQALFDAMFRDMDASLRELGVGDLGVPRRVAAMWQGFNGRCQAIDAALQAQDNAHAPAPAEDRPDLPDCLARNIWRGSVQPDVADRLARHVVVLDRSLAVQPDAALLDGVVRFEPCPGQAGRELRRIDL